MRLNLNLVNAHLIYQLELSGGIARVKQNGFDVIVAETPQQELIALHLIERDIDVGLIKNTLIYNAAHNQATLFILWSAMLLPEHGERYRPYDWMHALLALYDDRIYAYEVYDQHLYVFPVHFDRTEVGLYRSVRYGDRVDMARLRVEKIRLDSQYLTGYYTIADFESSTRQQFQPPNDANNSYDSTPLSETRNPLWVYYRVLGVGVDADWETIRKAYRQLAREFHPDVNKSEDALAKMQQINIAYQRISEIFGDAEEEKEEQD